MHTFLQKWNQSGWPRSGKGEIPCVYNFPLFSFVVFFFSAKDNTFQFVNGLQSPSPLKAIFSSLLLHKKYYKYSLSFPCLENLKTKFPVFPVPWPPLQCISEILPNMPIQKKQKRDQVDALILENCAYIDMRTSQISLMATETGAIFYCVLFRSS